MRIVALSDTHGYHKNLTIPDGDLLIHAGDFAMRAKQPHVLEFAKWINSLPHKYKIVVAGNHDCYCDGRDEWTREHFAPAIYLNHAEVVIEGHHIFGSPYSSSIFEPSIWSFDYPREGVRSKELWNQVPNGLSILITHGPPYGVLDLVEHPHDSEDPHVGDQNLLLAVQRTQPKVHLFGHIHEGYGQIEAEWYSHDGIHSPKTQFYNVSVCNLQYRPMNPITVIDL